MINFSQLDQFPLPPSSPLIPSTFSLSFREVQAFLIYETAMGYRVAARLGTSSLIKTGQGNQSGARTTKKEQARARACSLCQQSHKKTNPHNCSTCAEGPSQPHASSLVSSSVSMSTHEARSVGYGFSHNVFVFLVPLITPLPLPGLPEAHLTFGCGYLHLFLSVSG